MLDQDFIAQMHKELTNNKHKGEWALWHPSESELLTEMLYHVAKLTGAFSTGARPKIAEHSADIANIAMRAYTLYGE